MVRICKANGGHALLIPRFLLFSLLLVALYQLELFTPETAAAAPTSPTSSSTPC